MALKVERDNLPCIIVGSINYDNEIKDFYKDAEELILLNILNNIYKLEIHDEYMIQNPRYFTPSSICYNLLVECSKNGKIAKRNGDYCLIKLTFMKEKLLPRLPLDFEYLLDLDVDIINNEIKRLGLENKNDNYESLLTIQNYWQKLIYLRKINEDYEYNGMIIKYYNYTLLVRYNKEIVIGHIKY
jgi:hypothetical protein